MKKNFSYPLGLLLLLLVSAAHAQTGGPISQGSIEYEKRVNKYAVIKATLSNKPSFQADFETYQKNNAQFETSAFTLYFDNGQSLYVPKSASSSKELVDQVSASNIVYTNFLTNQFIAQKKVFTDNFLIKDGIRKIKWKITNETKEIAGYECRRANGIISDSIYVVAFYTIDVIPSGGPELFNGLPGMILGVSLPHEHITWFAKTVTDKLTPNFPKIKPPEKGKATDLSQLKSSVAAGLRQFDAPTLNVILKNLTY